MSVSLGTTIDDLPFSATSNLQSSLAKLKNKFVILYFYPKDNTSGCTLESQDFAKYHNDFLKQDAVVLGISRDSLKSHEKFKEKYELPFELISDTDENLCQYFNVIKLKNMYGKKVRGIDRSTFIIDKKGKLQHEWRGVKVKDHVNEVLAKLSELAR